MAKRTHQMKVSGVRGTYSIRTIPSVQSYSLQLAQCAVMDYFCISWVEDTQGQNGYGNGYPN